MLPAPTVFLSKTGPFHAVLLSQDAGEAVDDGGHGGAVGLEQVTTLVQPALRTITLKIWYLWFVSAFVYYGLVMVQPDMLAQEKACTRCEFNDHCKADDGPAVLSYSCGDFNHDGLFDYAKTPAVNLSAYGAQPDFMPPQTQVYFQVGDGDGDKCKNGTYSPGCAGSGMFYKVQDLTALNTTPPLLAEIPADTQAILADRKARQIYLASVGSAMGTASVAGACTGQCCAANTSCGSAVALETCGCTKPCVLNGVCPMEAKEYIASFVATVRQRSCF
eukprot:SAG22_NODE_326_length_12283_cov_248.386408_8_plen_276_part_00